MQCEILGGVPYFINAENRLFYWSADKKHSFEVGAYDPATQRITYKPQTDAERAQLAEILSSWRAEQVPRSRGNAAASKAAASENSDADE